MLKKPQFTVDESISQEDAEEALRDLRRMIRYGRMAERAMKSLQEKGYYDGLAPLAPETDQLHRGQYSVGKQKSDVRFAHLPKRLPISREDLGPMAELRLDFDKVETTSYSGNPCKEVKIYLEGPMAFQVASGLPKYKIDEDRRQIGKIRINKGHLSWLENTASGYGEGSAWRVYKEMKYAGAQESLAAFSKGASLILVKREDSDHVFAAKTLELQATAWEWFLADGHAERFFAEIHQMTKIAEVMDS
jgi:hypothetical protein